MGRTCSKYGGEQERVEAVGWNAREKETLRRPIRRWVKNIDMNLLGVGLGSEH
jgi:hypothetical protein